MTQVCGNMLCHLAMVRLLVDATLVKALQYLYSSKPDPPLISHVNGLSILRAARLTGGTGLTGDTGSTGSTDGIGNTGGTGVLQHSILFAFVTW